MHATASNPANRRSARARIISSLRRQLEARGFIEVDGTKASLEWHQENPNQMIVRKNGEPHKIYTRNGGPYLGAAAAGATRIPSGHPEEYYFVFSSFTQSWGVFRHRLLEDTVETVRAPEVNIPDAVVEDRWAVSADGVRVPYHTVRLAGVDTRPLPALIYAYGAFNVPLLPEYPGGLAAFIAAGGLYVHGHIRGGAELGLDWWRSGRMKNKQNCFRDLYAIAEDLIKQGLSTPAQLAMTGRSNGGLMAGVAATQRPDLWRAIVAQVPVMDLIGILRDSYGSYAVAKEYADPTDPDEVTRLAGFSPYHMVKAGTAYPAVFIDAGATDPRCPAWHARKFAARLQAATVARSAPILLRVRENAGHGPATAKAVQLEGTAEWLAFVMRELGMVPQGEPDAGATSGSTGGGSSAPGREPPRG
jgi:prolyl oligopeptidase